MTVITLDVLLCMGMYLFMYTSLFYQYLTYFSISVSVLYGGLRDKLFRNENCELPVLVVHSLNAVVPNVESAHMSHILGLQANNKEPNGY